MQGTLFDDSIPPLGPDWPSVPQPHTQTQPEQTDETPPDVPSITPSLDPDEITVRFAPPCPPGLADDDSAALHKTFRHSFWRRRRHTTLAALARQNASAVTQERFCLCGSTAWVLRDADDGSRFRLATNRCRNRWCEACARDRRRVVVGNLKSGLQGKELRLLTLTLAARSGPLADQLRFLHDSFRAFRHRTRIKQCMTGGIYFLELTYNDRTERWHPHLHIIFEGSFLPHSVAKATWHEITVDSYIVDLQSINGADGAASYVGKYATKAVGPCVWAHPDRLDEAMAALAGRRTFQTFGDWHALNLSRTPDDETDWEPMCTLATLIREAQDGDADSKRILSGLTNNFDLDPLDLPQPLGDST